MNNGHQRDGGGVNFNHCRKMFVWLWKEMKLPHYPCSVPSRRKGTAQKALKHFAENKGANMGISGTN